ncbi:MAG: hypothetical protein MZV64_53810 [Ignavibacteriales bacterium]|nr:hypothetical protein [Ignavibacteriales bacterium]
MTPRFGEVGLMFGGSYAAVKLVGSAGTLKYKYVRRIFRYLVMTDFSLLAEYDIANDLSSSDVKSNMLMVEAAYVNFNRT